MSNTKKTLNTGKNHKRDELKRIDRNVVKSSIKNNYDLDLVEGTEAYYSERYGWTLRKSK